MKITKLITATFAIAVATIFVSCSGGKSTSTSSSDSTSTAVTASGIAYNGKIAYIRMDSLMRGYGMYIDMSDELSKKGRNVEADITQRGRTLEKEVADFQDKAQKGLITLYQGQSIEKDLQKKQQELLQHRDNMMGQLQQEEMVMSNNISVAIMDYIKEYNNDKKYSMILQTTGSTPVLVADPSMDITTEVLTELNKRYLDTKSKETKK